MLCVCECARNYNHLCKLKEHERPVCVCQNCLLLNCQLEFGKFWYHLGTLLLSEFQAGQLGLCIWQKEIKYALILVRSLFCSSLSYFMKACVRAHFCMCAGS